MFKFANNSLVFDGGHTDELSYQSCKILLGFPTYFKVVEIIYAVEAIFTQHCIFTLVGAHYRDITLNGFIIEQNRVYEAHNKDILKFRQLERGFRLYLMASSFDQSRLGLFRGDFRQCFSPASDKIRVLKGPEFNYLKESQLFFERPFKISTNSDLSGIRLEGEKIEARQYDIVSSIVDDGLIQLTCNGPIVLLRCRQVTGGYPRIFSIIKTDLDFLAQYPMGSVVHFELIELAEAKLLLLQREQELKNMISRLESK